MQRLFAVLLVLFSAIGLAAAPVQAQIRIAENPIAWSTEVRSCDFEALVRELRVIVQEHKDEGGTFYTFSTEFAVRSHNDFSIELVSCPLWSAEKHTGKIRENAVAYGSHKLVLAYLSDFPLEMGMKDGYVQVLKRNVEVRLDLGWWSSLDAKKQWDLLEQLYQTMGPVTLKGRLTVDHERCGDGFDRPRSVEQLCKLVLRIYASELNGIKTDDPLAQLPGKP